MSRTKPDAGSLSTPLNAAAQLLAETAGSKARSAPVRTPTKALRGRPLYQNVTIGGRNLINGQPMVAVNPLSYAILESCGRLRLPAQPRCALSPE